MKTSKPHEVLNPEFTFSLDNYKPNQHHYAGISLELGQAAGKEATKSVLDIETANRSGYGLSIAIQMNWDGEWMEVTDVNRVRIAIQGDYERHDILEFLQQVGLLTLPVYGKIGAS